QADFCRISAEGPLWLNEIAHETTISVNEEGTRLAAATATIVLAGIWKPPPVEVVFNRPFVIVIYHRPMMAVVALGRVLDPSAGQISPIVYDEAVRRWLDRINRASR